jgi:predicted nucleic acid-binding protein
VLYLDTNLFLDITRNRNNEFTRTLFHEIKCDQYEAVTSTFTLLEIVQEEQERAYAEKELIHNKRSFDEIRSTMHERKLTKSTIEDVYDSVWKNLKPYTETEKISVQYLDEEGWDFAIDIQRKMDISASDAIHVAVAFKYGCDIFVTSDNQLIRNCSKHFKPQKLLFSTPSELKRKEKSLEKKTILKLIKASEAFKNA